MTSTKFVWKIENFTCLKGEMLQSPTFSSHSLNWQATISTSSAKGTEVIDISLHRHLTTCVVLHCSLAFLDSSGLPLIWKEKNTFTFDFGCGQYVDSVTFDNFIHKSEMFGSRKTKFLPNNTLTVQCLIWKSSEELVLLPLKCFARTRIEPKAVTGMKSFKWNIVNAISFTTPHIRVEEIGTNFASLTIKLLFNSEGKLEVTFAPSLYGVHLKVKISVLNVMGGKNQYLNKEVQFLQKEEKKLQTNITKIMLTIHKNLVLHQDTLLLQFDCTLSTKFTFHDIVNENEILTTNPQPTVATSPISEPSKYADEFESKQSRECTDESESKQTSRNKHSDSVLQNMYEGFLSDCVLKVGSREFPVHKAVLGSRSRFFRAMFTTDMKENNTNFVDIKDVDEDTLQRLLRFVYLDEIEEQMGWERALKLYAAADMYAIESLQRKCSAILDSALCVSSVLDVLKLADAHHDEDLKASTLGFISSNDSEIIGTQSWLTFEKENATLVIETLRKLYLQKMSC